jgi:hypothetical protein
VTLREARNIGLEPWELGLGFLPLAVGVLWFAVLRREHARTAARHAADREMRSAQAELPLGQEELDAMTSAAENLTVLGAVLLGQAAWLVLVVLIKFYSITDHYALLLASAKDFRFQMLGLLVVRTAAYGTVATTAIYVFGRFALASFDQSTRFRKRIHSAHVLNAMVLRYDPKGVKMDDILKAFRDWNATIESAFTRPHKFGDPRESASAKWGAANVFYGVPKDFDQKNDDK